MSVVSARTCQLLLRFHWWSKLGWMAVMQGHILIVPSSGVGGRHQTQTNTFAVVWRASNQWMASTSMKHVSRHPLLKWSSFGFGLNARCFDHGVTCQRRRIYVQSFQLKMSWLCQSLPVFYQCFDHPSSQSNYLLSSASISRFAYVHWLTAHHLLLCGFLFNL